MRIRDFLFLPLTAHSCRERFFLWSSVITGVFFLIFDQATKFWIERSFELYESRPVINGWLSWTSVRNHGAAWSILSGYGWILLAIAIVALAALLLLFHKIAEGYPERYFSIFIIVSGILGNSIDRLWRGAVVDFIDFHYYDIWRYPVFNIADIAICTGVGIFILSVVFRPDNSGKRKNADS